VVASIACAPIVTSRVFRARGKAREPATSSRHEWQLFRDKRDNAVRVLPNGTRALKGTAGHAAMNARSSTAITSGARGRSAPD